MNGMPYPSSRSLTIQLPNDDTPFNLKRLQSLVFVQALRELRRENGRLSVRDLAKHLLISKSEISRRFRRVRSQEMISLEELNQIVKRDLRIRPKVKPAQVTAPGETAHGAAVEPQLPPRAAAPVTAPCLTAPGAAVEPLPTPRTATKEP